MARLFFTLYLMVIASFLVFIFYMQAVETIGDSIGEGADIDERVSIGTFRLLNKSLEGLDDLQKGELLQNYKALFGNEFRLANISTLDLTKKLKSKLDNERVVSIEEPRVNLNLIAKDIVIEEDENEDINVLYYKSSNANQVWRAELDYEIDLNISESGISVHIEGGKFSKGMMYLLQSKLKPKEEAQWENILNGLQTDFILPLKLIDNNVLGKNLSEQETLRIQRNGIVNISQGTSYTTLVQQIANSQKLIQVGPVKVPWHMRYIPYIFIGSFILSFATTLLLWLWPFWTNLIRIKEAATEFGKGNYNARIKKKWWTPVAKISNAFNSMAEQTQQSIRKQKELTNAVSHELRTPVARMRFALEMLSASDSTSDKKRYLNDINTDIDELDLLLEELLSYARFNQDDLSIKFSSIKLTPWYNKSMDKLSPLASAKRKNLSYSVDGIKKSTTVQIEPRLMSRVLDNLVQNALRYADSKVEVSLNKEENNYLLAVQDDGIGIPKKERERIFDAFSRIDSSRDRASGGFGLGLAIADRIIKGHGGEITLHSSQSGGACFEVRFPLS